MKAGVLKNKSSIVNKYDKDLQEWASYIEEYENILAISRKGPRLLELLFADGMLSEKSMHCVFTEHAMPFIKDVKKLVIIDDSVLYGSTMLKNASRAKKLFDIEGSNIELVPFKYSTETPEKIKMELNRSVSRVCTPDESSYFINTLISSFKSLGKPYDLEFPIIYYNGDFSDSELLRIKLEKISNLISGSKFLINTNNNSPDSYTILFDSGENDECLSPEFSKIRIYVNESGDRLAFVPIAPFIISNDIFDNLKGVINPIYLEIWDIAVRNIQTIGVDVGNFSIRSLVVLFNYLASLSFLISKFSSIDINLKKSDLYIEQYDLQLLLGVELSNFLINKFNLILTTGETMNFQSDKLIKNAKDCIIPKEVESSYSDYLNKELDSIKNINSEFEIINSVFRSQHKEIELKTRTHEKYEDAYRLNFGLSLKNLISIVKNNNQNFLISNTHKSLDYLIDAGAIVPKYLNVSEDINHSVWRRVFRVGEGGVPTSQQQLAFVKAFQNLSNCFESPAISPLVLEKYIVMAYTNTFKFEELNDSRIRDLNIKRVFGKYGARSYVNTINNDELGFYYIDWAEHHRLALRNNKRELFLNSPVVETFDMNELAFSNLIRDKLEDLANFCFVITSELSENALVTITTLTSEGDYYDSLVAELNLWLNSPSYNIFTCINKLEELKSNRSLLNDCRVSLEENARLTAEVAKKKELFTSKDQLLDRISLIVKNKKQSQLSRIWRDIQNDILAKNEKLYASVFVEEILTILRIAHKLTSLCRSLLNVAGLPKNEKIEYKTIPQHLEDILKILDISNRESESSFSVRKHFNERGIQNAIRNVIVDYDENFDFDNSLLALRKVLYSIADACSTSFIEFGSKVKNEPIRILNPPVYILMWDICDSTSAEDRVELEKNVIFPINQKIKSIIEKRGILKDIAITGDDGNFFLTDNFLDVLNAFEIISKIGNSRNVKFRMGCEVNIEGELHFYEERKIISGRGYEFAARTMSFFKEIKANAELWSGKNVIENHQSYLLVSEFARRFAEINGQWLYSDNLILNELDGLYTPRVRKYTRFPYRINEITYKN